MSWVDIKNKPKVGDWVLTSKIHSHPGGIGYFEKGSLVQITAAHPKDGYTISDLAGHVIEKIGWMI